MEKKRKPLKFFNFENDWPFFLIFSLSFLIQLIEQYYVNPQSFDDLSTLLALCLGSAFGDMLLPCIVGGIIYLPFKLMKLKFYFYYPFVLAWLLLIVPFHCEKIAKHRDLKAKKGVRVVHLLIKMVKINHSDPLFWIFTKRCPRSGGDQRGHAVYV